MPFTNRSSDCILWLTVKFVAQLSRIFNPYKKARLLVSTFSSPKQDEVPVDTATESKIVVINGFSKSNTRITIVSLKSLPVHQSQISTTASTLNPEPQDAVVFLTTEVV